MKKVMNNHEIDLLIGRALDSADSMIVSEVLVEKTIRKIEKRAFLKEVIVELAFKVMLVIGSIAVLSGVMIWFSGFELVQRFTAFIQTNRQLVIMVTLGTLVVIFIDQIVLKYYIRNPILRDSH